MSGSVMSLNTPALAPSILTADFARLREQVREAEDAGVDLIHLDVMDGHFVPNISFGPIVVSAISSITTLPVDVHLMIERPERYIDAFAEAGANIISIHHEATHHPHRVIQQIKRHEIDAGVALNPATPVVFVEDLLSIVDMVLVMSVNPGFGGQSFLSETNGKLQRLHSLLGKHGRQDVRVEVDGGINIDTIQDAYTAGAEIFVCGSSVYNGNESVQAAVKKLRGALSR
jgi:ribulose-phosphate 3-epimerase